MPSLEHPTFLVGLNRTDPIYERFWEISGPERVLLTR